jgi:cyclopropane fatty-acyl-phospholipid synthase-like methyltransferase
MAPAPLTKLRRYGRLLNQARHGLTYLVNDEVYWDRYVKDWEASDDATLYDVLGAEWKNEERFLDALRRHTDPAATALEIGCGGGRITRTAVELVRHVHACDVSREMLRKAQDTVPAANLSFHKLDGFTLDEFAPDSVDVVYSHDVFVHFSSLQVYPYLQEIRRVLRPGGVGLLSFYNFVRHFELFRELSLYYWRSRRYPSHQRIHFLTEEMARTMLADLQLDIVDTDTENYLIVAFRKADAVAETAG